MQRISGTCLMQGPMYHLYAWYIWYIGYTGRIAKRRIPDMEIHIDIDDPAPPFEQLIEQIKAAVTAGILTAGDPLPSIRQLANDLDLNNKTVAKAYRLLERDSIIQTKGYRGTYIHPEAKTNCQFDLHASTARKLQDVIDELREAGVTDSEIRNAFTASMNNRIPTRVRTGS
jgi:GntR family transcriptional regulator